VLDFGYYNMDCMAGMREFPDKFFDLAIVDPPYGIGEANGRIRARKKDNWYQTTIKNVEKKGSRKEWDLKRPNKEYFNELFRVSKNQIIWGANYYPEHLAGSMGWIFWDKKLAGDFSDGELAFTSFDRALRKFTHFNGHHNKIHPTQKPVALYRWLLQNYAKPGDRLISTHVGSASDLIAFEMEGFTKYVGFELDADYYRDSVKRLETWRKSRTIDIFQPQELRQIEQSKLRLQL